MHGDSGWWSIQYWSYSLKTRPLHELLTDVIFFPPHIKHHLPGWLPRRQYSTTSISHRAWSAPSPPLNPSSIHQDYSSLNTRLTPFLPRHILTIPLDCCSSKTLQPRIVPSMNFGCHCTRMPSSFPPKNDVLLNDVLLIFQYSGEGWGNSRLLEMEMNEIYVMTLK